MVDRAFAARRAALLARMGKIPVAVRIAVRNQLDAEAAGLVEAIRPNVPKDHGDLADSLEWHRNASVTKLSVTVTEGASDESATDGVKGSKARAVEFGRGGDNPMEAQPHFYPVYRARKRPLRRRLNKAAKTAILKVLS